MSEAGSRSCSTPPRSRGRWTRCRTADRSPGRRPARRRCPACSSPAVLRMGYPASCRGWRRARRPPGVLVGAVRPAAEGAREVRRDQRAERRAGERGGRLGGVVGQRRVAAPPSARRARVRVARPHPAAAPPLRDSISQMFQSSCPRNTGRASWSLIRASARRAADDGVSPWPWKATISLDRAGVLRNARVSGRGRRSTCERSSRQSEARSEARQRADHRNGKRTTRAACDLALPLVPHNNPRGANRSPWQSAVGPGHLRARDRQYMADHETRPGAASGRASTHRRDCARHDRRR